MKARPTFDAGLVRGVREGLALAANPSKAPKMQAYMKSVMPYRGVSAPEQRTIFKPLFDKYRIANQDTWMATALVLWREATYREERYAAIALTGDPKYRVFQDLSTLPMYEEFIADGAWWDHVDAVAIHRVGPLLDLFPDKVGRLMLRWSDHDDMWRRRTSIICQVARRTDTDLDLLYRCIEPNITDRRFFIRKAIGWALRSYAWVDAKEIARYVEENSMRLSGLSKREALKNA